MKEDIRKRVLGFGADVCGFASISRFNQAPKGFHPCDIYSNCKSVIVGKTLMEQQKRDLVQLSVISVEVCAQCDLTVNSVKE